MTFLKKVRAQPRWRLIAAGGVVAALVGGAAVIALQPALSDPSASSPTSGPRATPTPTIEPEPVLVPTADVAAAFDGWNQANEDDIESAFTAEAGNAGDGSISLRVESTNPAENPARRTLSQIVAVTPSTEYTFTAEVLNTAGTKTSPGVVVTMGVDGRFDLKKATAEWSVQTWTYTTGEAESELPFSIATVGPTAETRIDNLTMATTGSSENLLANGSFEAFTAANPQITNASLLLTTGEAALGVSWRIPGASWTITDQTGATVDEGTVDLNPGLGVVSMQDLDAGYYSIEIVNDEAATERLHTSLAILDPLAPDALASDERFGVGIHFTPPFVNSGEVAAEIGFSMARSDVKWNQVENTPNQYDFPATLDAEVKDFADAGLEFLPISVYSNKLYDRGRTPSSPGGIQAFANFSKEIAAHYQTPAIEVYNEFNNPPMNKGDCGTSAECYMPLLKATAETIRADHPETVIVGPATARQDDAWLTALYAAGGLEYLDAISFHPYDYSPESGPEFLEASLIQATNRIKEYNNGVSKPIWITELGWSTTGYSEADQADNVVRSETIALANGVEKFFWYDLVNDKADEADHEGNFGLVRQTTDTVPAFAPKPSALAQTVLIRKVAGKEYTQRDSAEDSTTYSYAFGSGQDATRVAWATRPATVVFDTTGPVTVTDQFGKITVMEPVSGQITVDLTGHPVYLDGDLAIAP